MHPIDQDELLREAAQTIRDLLTCVKQLMPGLKHIAVRDYAILNDAPARARLTLIAIDDALPDRG